MSNVDRIEECRISLHHLEFRTDAPQERRVGPTKSMPSDAFFNSLVFHRWPNVPAQDRVSPARFPAPIPPASEDPIFRLSIGGALPPLRQGLRQKGMERNRLLRRFGFAWANDSVDYGASHVHDPSGKINVAPFQTEQLALPQASGCCKQDQGPFAKAKTLQQRSDFYRLSSVGAVFRLALCRTRRIELRSNSPYLQAWLKRTDIKFGIFAQLLLANGKRRSQDSTSTVLIWKSPYSPQWGTIHRFK